MKDETHMAHLPFFCNMVRLALALQLFIVAKVKIWRATRREGKDGARSSMLKYEMNDWCTLCLAQSHYSWPMRAIIWLTISSAMLAEKSSCHLSNAMTTWLVKKLMVLMSSMVNRHSFVCCLLSDYGVEWLFKVFSTVPCPILLRCFRLALDSTITSEKHRNEERMKREERYQTRK